VREFHEVWGYIAIVANAVAGLYALAAWRWRHLRGALVWAATVAAEITMVVQVLTGVWLVAVDDYERPNLHMFYGFLTFIAIGILVSYRYVFRARDWMELAYGLGGLFIMGLGIRAVVLVGQ
jgi:hypothetical protein